MALTEHVAQGEVQESQVGLVIEVLRKVPAVQFSQVLVEMKKPRPISQAVHLVAWSTHSLHGSVHGLQIGRVPELSKNVPGALHSWQVLSLAKKP